MKTKEELELKIINITAKIHTEFPELSKYISEMPQNNAEKEAVNIINLEKYCDSLVSILAQYDKTHTAKDNPKNSDKKVYADLQNYPPSEDIYNQLKQETDLNPEDTSKQKTPNELEGMPNEKSFKTNKTGSDLDVPGSDLDDEQENVGSEDEENNYYSIGGDNHNDLDEDKG